MSQSKIASIRSVCGQWNYARGVELSDPDKELFGYSIALRVMRGAPISLSTLDEVFHHLRSLGLFESTYELQNNALPTEAELIQIEADSARWAAERIAKGINVKFAWKTALGIPVYIQEGTCC